MRGVDGNFLKTQAEMMAKMQVAFMADQTAQQLRAQAQNLESVRQLTEQVGTTAKSDGKNQPPKVNDDSQGGEATQQGHPEGRKSKGTEENKEADLEPIKIEGQGHIDLRI